MAALDLVHAQTAIVVVPPKTRWEKLSALCTAGSHVEARTVDELPEWGAVLNDQDMELGGSQRDPQIALLAPSQALCEQDGAFMHTCFLVTTKEHGGSAQCMSLVTRALQSKYRIAGKIFTSPHTLNVLYHLWDEQRGQRHRDRLVAVEESEMERRFDEVCYTAFKLGASDIHITAMRGRGFIKFRVLGKLEVFDANLTEDWAMDFVSTIYNTLYERGSTKEGFMPHEPQDAVIERVYPEGRVRFRYAHLPLAPCGVDVTLRIIPLGVKASHRPLSELGYSADQCDEIERIFSCASGLILICGTTGSGKSTTLANELMRKADEEPGIKIRTVEEPVEFRIEGTYQSSVLRKTGTSEDFLKYLRATLRGDPDVIMVGEIRDLDTAVLTQQAVRSGHLVASTLHAQGVLLAFDRLVEMGLPRQSLASVGLFAGIIYQRLLSVLCQQCKRPARLAFGESKKLDAALRRAQAILGGLDGIYVRRNGGCPACERRGYEGRTVCAEILRPTRSMIPFIATGDTLNLEREMRAAIRDDQADCMRGRSAREHAIWKMKHGILAPADVELAFGYLDEVDCL